MVNVIITDAGIAEIVNAENNGTAPVILSEIALGTGKYTPAASQTALQAEIKRITNISGGNAGDNIIHLSMLDESSDSYTVYEVGVFTDKGTLFAVCSQNTPILQKAAVSRAGFALDIALTNVNPESIAFGDTNFVLNSATTEQQGIIELATEAEAKAGTDTHRAVTPKALDVVIEGHDNIVHRSGAETITGTKTFDNIQLTGDAPYIRVGNNDVVKGTTPEAGKYWGISFSDSEGYVSKNRLSLIETSYSKEGNVTLSMGVYKPEHDNSTAMTKLSVVYPASGNPYATAPTPAAGDNSTKIATTAWVTAKAKEYLPLAGGTLTGTISKHGGTFLNNTNSESSLVLTGDKLSHNASVLMLFGLEHSDFPGGFIVRAGNNTNSYTLLGKADGSLVWDSKNIVRSVNNVNANVAGNVTITSVSGNAGTATKLQTARTITLAGDVTGSTTFDGSGNVSITATVKDDSHSHSNYLPLSGGTLTGTLNVADYLSIKQTVDNGSLRIYGGTSETSAGALFFGKSHSTLPGQFYIRSYTADGNTSADLIGNATAGTLTWKGKHIVRSVDGVNADTAGNVALNALPKSGGAMTSITAMTRDVNNSYLSIIGGTGLGYGAQIDLCGQDHSSIPGGFQIHARNSAGKDFVLRGQIDGTLRWDSKYVLNNYFSMPTDTSGIVLNGGTDYTKGAYIRAYGKDNADYPGWFTLGASDGAKASALRGLPDGTLTWNGYPVEVGHLVTSGDNWYIKYPSGLIIQGIFVANDDNNNTDKTVTLPTAMASTSYMVQINPVGTYAYAEESAYVVSRTKTSLVMRRNYHTHGTLIFIIGF